jgi:methyl-accepting chemotaxis protein
MEKLKLKKYLSIETKTTIGIVLFVNIFMGLITYVSFINYKVVSRNDLNHHLSSMVSIASMNVDAEKHSLLKTIVDEETQAYKDIKKSLQIIIGSDPEVTYVYTMRENDKNEIEFIVDAEESLENISHTGDVYTDASPYLKNNFKNINNIVIENDFTTDKWGTWLSGYAPFYDKNGKREGVIGIDIKAEDILNKEREMASIYILTFILGGLIAILVGIRLSRKITKSISSLSKMLEDGKCLDVFPSSNDEIGELKNAFETILDKNNALKIDIEEKLIGESKTIDKINKILAEKEVEIAKLKQEINSIKK